MGVRLRYTFCTEMDIYEIFRNKIWKYEIFRSIFATKLFGNQNETHRIRIRNIASALAIRQVNDELSTLREIGYTTTLKLLQIMNEKHLVSRIEEGRYHVYKAEVGEEQTQNLLLDRFVDATFRGSAMKLVMQTLGNHQASKEELEEIKKLIESLEK